MELSHLIQILSGLIKSDFRSVSRTNCHSIQWPSYSRMHLLAVTSDTQRAWPERSPNRYENHLEMKSPIEKEVEEQSLYACPHWQPRVWNIFWPGGDLNPRPRGWQPNTPSTWLPRTAKIPIRRRLIRGWTGWRMTFAHCAKSSRSLPCLDENDTRHRTRGDNCGLRNGQSIPLLVMLLNWLGCCSWCKSTMVCDWCARLV